MNGNIRKFKSEAETLLPGNELKNSVKSRLFEGASVSSVSKNTPAPAPRRRNYSKVFAAVAACLVICIAAGLGIYFGTSAIPDAPVSDTYLSVEINPSFGIVADKYDIVKSVSPLNKDAAIVVYGLDFKGLSVTETVSRLAAVSAKLGYLDTTEKGQVSLLVVNDNASKENAVSASVRNTLSDLFGQNKWNTSIYFKASEADQKEAKKLNVTAGKEALLDEVCKLTGKSKNELKNYTAEQLNLILLGVDEDELADFENTLDDKFAQSLGNDKKLIDQLSDAGKKLERDIEKLDDFLDKLEEGKIGVSAYFDLLKSFLNDYSDAGLTEILGDLKEILIGLGIDIFNPNFDVSGDELYDKLGSFYDTLEEKLEVLDNRIEELEDRLEDSLDSLKEGWKNEWDNDDDEDDD